MSIGQQIAELRAYTAKTVAAYKVSTIEKINTSKQYILTNINTSKQYIVTKINASKRYLIETITAITNKIAAMSGNLGRLITAARLRAHAFWAWSIDIVTTQFNNAYQFTADFLTGFPKHMAALGNKILLTLKAIWNVGKAIFNVLKAIATIFADVGVDLLKRSWRALRYLGETLYSLSKRIILGTYHFIRNIPTFIADLYHLALDTLKFTWDALCFMKDRCVDLTTRLGEYIVRTTLESIARVMGIVSGAAQFVGGRILNAMIFTIAVPVALFEMAFGQAPAVAVGDELSSTSEEELDSSFFSKEVNNSFTAPQPSNVVLFSPARRTLFPNADADADADSDTDSLNEKEQTFTNSLANAENFKASRPPMRR